MHFQILVGTTSGNTEYLAEQMATELRRAGHQTTVHDQPELSELPYDAETNAHWLICVATHGAGEYAESIIGFIEAIKADQPDLSNVKMAIIAIGDSSYDTFCQAGKDCEALLLELGATLIHPTLTIDMFNDLDPEQSAAVWLKHWLKQLTNR